VYEGGVSDNPESYRYYRDLFATFTSFGFNVFLIPSGWSPAGKRYENQVNVIGPMDYINLLRTMRSFGLGIVGSQEYVRLMHAAMPNKMYEYISAGTVPLIFNMGEAAEFVTQNEIGLDMTALAGIDGPGIGKKEIIEKAMACRKNILQIRQTLFLEDHIQPLIDLYKSL
jgi:hypothetical protein